METNPVKTDTYSLAASDAFLAQFGDEDIEQAATKHALQAIIADKQRRAATASDTTTIPSQKQPAPLVVTSVATAPKMSSAQREAELALERTMKELTDALRAGDVEVFARRFNAARHAPEPEYGSIAVTWLITYSRSDYFNDSPQIASWLLHNGARTIRQVPEKWRHGLLVHLASNPTFIPTRHWLTITLRIMDLKPGHVSEILQKTLRHPTTASAFIRSRQLLKKLPANERMELAQIALATCELPSYWATFALSVGFTEGEIASLITMRCKLILSLEPMEEMSQNDKQFLTELLRPAKANGLSYRNVLTRAQLTLVVLTVRRRHPHRGSEQVNKAIAQMCIGTMRQRYQRL